MKEKPTKNFTKELLSWLTLPFRLLLTFVVVLAMAISTPFAWIAGALKALFGKKKRP